MSSFDKPVILTFIGNYLPGFKAGGILRAIVNTVDHLCDEFEFRIVTRDRDLGDHKPYADIKINQWQKVGNAMVYYLPPSSSKLKSLFSLIAGTPHHVLYLNSFFDPITIKVLLNRSLHRSLFRAVIVAPWGEFGWASLKQKYFKKFVFITVAKIFGLYDNVIWRASSEFEKKDILKYMDIKADLIHITSDFPIKNNPDSNFDLPSYIPSDDREGLRLVFLSRISREKNLDYALRVLKKVKSPVIFDIYGPAENLRYWKECQELMDQLPSNVKAKYLGSVNADQVINIFSRYDLFFFPTGGEAYGHVIAECLTAGTPALISTETPWRQLQKDGLGWDIDLAQMDVFVERIEKLSLKSPAERLKSRTRVRTKAAERLFSPVVQETNRQLFLNALTQ